MMTDLTPIINFIIALLGALVTAFVIPWIKRKLSKEDQENLIFWVKIAVSAAQQIYYQSSGAERLKYVLNFLKSKGFDVDLPEVQAAIEAEVLRLHQELEGKEAQPE